MYAADIAASPPSEAGMLAGFQEENRGLRVVSLQRTGIAMYLLPQYLSLPEGIDLETAPRSCACISRTAQYVKLLPLTAPRILNSTIGAR